MIKVLLLLLTTLASTALAETESTFDEPSCLASNIQFWYDIYTKYDQSDGLIIDANSPEVHILEHISLPSNPKKLKLLVLRTKANFSQVGIKVRLIRGIKSRFEAGVKNYLKLKPLIEEEVFNQGLPKEISLLPHVESSFNPKARSKVGAKGLWQVMPSTARMYGFNPKKLMDPTYNTKAGLAVLSDNFNELGSWPLALTAYNHGLQGVKRAVKEVGSLDTCKIISEYKGSRFGTSSRNFYASFLAVLRILKERDLF